MVVSLADTPAAIARAQNDAIIAAIETEIAARRKEIDVLFIERIDLLHAAPPAQEGEVQPHPNRLRADALEAQTNAMAKALGPLQDRMNDAKRGRTK